MDSIKYYQRTHKIYPHLAGEEGGTEKWEETVIRQLVSEFLVKIPIEEMKKLFSIECAVHSDPYGHTVNTYTLSVKI